MAKYTIRLPDDTLVFGNETDLVDFLTLIQRGRFYEYSWKDKKHFIAEKTLRIEPVDEENIIPMTKGQYAQIHEELPCEEEG